MFYLLSTTQFQYNFLDEVLKNVMRHAFNHVLKLVCLQSPTQGIYHFNGGCVMNAKVTGFIYQQVGGDAGCHLVNFK